MAFRVLPEYNRIVGTVAGTVDVANGFLSADWLVDPRPSFPAKNVGTLDLVVTPPAAMDADLFALVNHNVEEALDVPVTRNGGTAVGNVTPGPWGKDGIPKNPYLLLDAPVNVTSLRIVVAGNDVDPVAKLWAGLSVVLPGYQHGRAFDPGDPFDWEAPQTNPADDGLSVQRRLQGTIGFDVESDFEEFAGIYEASLKGTIPTLFVPDDLDPDDALLCVWRYSETHAERLHQVQLQMVEVPRTRW